jgi:hypothetical protein
MTRQEANLILVESLKEIVLKYPDLRFGQILVDFGIIRYISNTYDESLITIDPFNEESVTTLQNFKDRFNQLTNKDYE